MRGAEESSAAPKPSSLGSAQGSLSPIKAFALLMSVVVAIIIIANLTRSPSAPSGAPRRAASSADYSLTNKEAKKRFAQLERLSTLSYVRRDRSLIPVFSVAKSPLRSIALRDIKKLLAKNVVFRPSISRRSLSILKNRKRTIVLREIVVESPRFFLESGREVSNFHGRILQTLDWTLKPEGSVWKLFDLHVIKTVSLDKEQKR
jgi:hypothetical protein